MQTISIYNQTQLLHYQDTKVYTKRTQTRHYYVQHDLLSSPTPCQSSIQKSSNAPASLRKSVGKEAHRSLYVEASGKVILSSHELEPSSREGAEDHDARNDTDNAKEPCKAVAILPRDFHVHSPQTADEVHRDEHGGDQGDLAQHLVHVVAQDKVVHIQLRKIVGVGSAEHLFKVAQIRHHRNDVVLDVAKVEANITTRGHRVLFVTALGEALDDIRLATQETHQAHHFLS